MTREHRILLFQPRQRLMPRDGAVKPERRLSQPGYDFSWSRFRSVRFMLQVQSADGGPTSWSFHPRLEIASTSVSGYQDTNAFWRTLNRDEAAAMTREGEWLPDMDQNTPLPGLWWATIEEPPAAMRINLGEYYAPVPNNTTSPTDISLFNATHPDRLIMTGGTDPNLRISLVAYVKE